MNTTAVIRTIGRKTLDAAIKSCLTEKIPVIVVADGCDIVQTIKSGNVKYIKTGRQWGYYGHMGINVGAALANTEFITVVDDDDELAEGAGTIIRNRLQKHPEIDIWIPGLAYNTGFGSCLNLNNKGVIPGNIAVPTYRTDLFYKIPFSLKQIEQSSLPEQFNSNDYFDYLHVLDCYNNGYKIDWIKEIIYKVRPKLEGTNGRGK